jgi:hypothetical protein
MWSLVDHNGLCKSTIILMRVYNNNNNLLPVTVEGTEGQRRKICRNTSKSHETIIRLIKEELQINLFDKT